MTEQKKYKYKACVIGQLNARQKIMTNRFLRESNFPVIAMDEYNAKEQKIAELAEYVVVFSKGNELEDGGIIDQLTELGFTIGRIMLEDETFENNEFPKL